jgi:hypothetical protein
MAVQLFGFQIGRKEQEEQPPSVQSFAPPPNDDGAVAVNEGGVFGTTVDLDGTAKNESLLITKYREMSQQPECERAIDDVINEAIIGHEKESSVSIVLDDIDNVNENIKQRIREEFDGVLRLLKFNIRSYDIFKNWYVDGRIYYHVMIDIEKPNEGIKELRYIDPRKIKKVRVQKKDPRAPIANQAHKVVPKKYDEYFIYSPKGVSSGNQGLKIAPDAMAYVHSGVQNEKNSMILSHLHKAIKPLNQLRMLEDAVVIYRLARAPERRIFYIDVGNLPNGKAEQYVRDMMTRHKNKLVYDANTGQIRDDRKYMTMLEDYWLPRKEGSRGTEISTLPGGQNLGEMDDVDYFKQKLYEALNVPTSRLQSDGQFNLGRSSEITRDELKFSKFINRLRQRFTELFNVLLEKQLLLKGVMTKQEWKELKEQIHYDFLEDNHFTELKNNEVMMGRMGLLRELDEYVGKYYSVEWVRKNVLMQTEDDVKEIDKEIASEVDQYGDEDQEEN